jgi:hypothetical protein
MSAAAPPAASGVLPRPAAPDSPASPAPQRPAASVAPPPAADDPPGPADDSRNLLALLAVFLVAPLVVVAAICVVASVNTWWALAFGLCVYFAATAIVFATVAFVLAGTLPLPSRRHRAH